MIFVKNYFSILMFTVLHKIIYNKQPNIVLFLSYMWVTKLTIVCYVNKAFVYILIVEVKIPLWDLNFMC